MAQIWRAGGPTSGTSAALARACEAEGWDGQMFMDSQCLCEDPWVAMGLWAGATERLLLSPGVTNPLTRNLAVTAAAAASLHAVSGGRAVLGIGRGDSSLAWLGHGPVGVARFETALRHLQVLLSGGEIPFADFGSAGEAPSSHGLSLGSRPEAVRLRWLPESLGKVPLDVAATGPRVIALGAPLAERVTFSVGAEVDRMAWALDTARSACEAAGLAGDACSYGAQVVVVCNPDMDAAMAYAVELAPPLARFQTMQGEVGPADAAMRENLGKLRDSYDMTEHGNLHATSRMGGETLSPEFVARFAVVGSPEHCFARLKALIDLGLERLVVVGPGLYPATWGSAAGLFVSEVLPALQAA